MAYSLIITYNIKTGKYSYTIDITSPYDGCIICPCSNIDKHVFKSMSSFIIHTKTYCHQKWIQELSLKKI